MENNRIIWIDAAKGLGILLVMFSHLINVGNYIVSFYMAMFFIIAGYFIPSQIFVKKFIAKKAIRLLIPYFFYGISINCIVLLTVWLKNKLTIQTFVDKFIGLLYSRYCLLPLGVDGNTYYLSAFAPAWFLTVLFMASILFIPFLYLRSKQIKWLIFLYFVISFLLNKLPILLPWSLDTAFIGALFIFIGYKLKNNNIKSPPNEHKCLLWLIAMLGIYILLVKYNGSINMSVRVYGSHLLSPIIFFVIGILGSFIYFYLLKRLENTFIVRVFAKLSNYTVSLLCTHVFVYYCVRKLQLIVNFDDRFYTLIAFFTALCMGIILKNFFTTMEQSIAFTKYL